MTDLSDVDIYRTTLHAATASNAHDTLVIFINKIFEFMHEPLPDPLNLYAPWVVAGCMAGKQRRHAGIPVPKS